MIYIQHKILSIFYRHEKDFADRLKHHIPPVMITVTYRFIGWSDFSVAPVPKVSPVDLYPHLSHCPIRSEAFLAVAPSWECLAEGILEAETWFSF